MFKIHQIPVLNGTGNMIDIEIVLEKRKYVTFLAAGIINLIYLVYPV